MRRDQDVKQVEETRGLVLQSAQREFLDKGYEKASLRSIAQNAGVTTGALYVRFPNKSALFAALVEPVSAHLLGLFRTGNDQGFEQLDEGRPTWTPCASAALPARARPTTTSMRS